MGTKLVPLNINANNRLWLAGGRAEMPEGTMRRLVGAAPEQTGSIISRWGSKVLYPIAANSVYKWNGHRYAYDGATLYQDGVPFILGFTGGRLSFVTMPPQIGLENYLFILGGGKLLKIAPDGTITNWGIDAPPNGAAAQAGVPAQIVIDEMVANNVADWTKTNCTMTFDSADDPYLDGGCYKVHVPSFGPWYVTKTYVSFQDWSEYPMSGPISLQSDIMSLYAQFSNPNQVVWLWIMVDVDDGSFKKNYYRLTIQIVPSSSNVHAAAADVIIIPDAHRWVQLAGTKNQFQRSGTDLNLDWSHVKAVRIEGGDPNGDATNILLNGFQLYGGYPLGIGPAALLGGSEYQYAVTFGNSVTGSDSNPNGMAVQPDGSVAPPTPFVAQGCALGPNALSDLPVSGDSQVDSRKLWRTTAGGAIFAYLDTIPDNTTKTYTDVTGDLPGQPIIVTPWVKSVAVAVGYKVDGGNGFWFEVSAIAGSGTTGATLPAWNIPTGPFLGDWVPWITYAINDWVNYGGVGYKAIAESRGAVPGSSPSDWTALGTTIDHAGANQVVWAWGGLNAVRTLGLSDTLLFDNAPPQLVYGDAAGPFESSIIWTRDSTPQRKGWAYFSPPGRPESVGTSLVVSSDDDPAQKAVVWDGLPWVLSTKRIFLIAGSYPALSPEQLKGGLGTEFPYTVVVAQNGIYYRGPDGMRQVDRAGSVLVGFDALATILRGRQSENVAPFNPVWGGLARDEIFWGDGTVTFGLSGQSPKSLLQAPNQVWRMLGQALNCAFYEADDNEILASYGGVTVLFEHEGTYNDGQVETLGGIMRVTQVSIEVLMPNV